MEREIRREDWEPYSDERFRAFIESIQDGVYETDAHGHFTYFNNALCSILGYPREEILGRSFAEFMDRTHARMAYNAFTQVWVTHRGFTDIIWEVIDKRGETRIIELSASVIKDQRGKKKGFRGTARDVTERFKAQEALRESELRYKRAYEASLRAERQIRNQLDFVPYPMVVFDLDGKVMYLNPAFTETFGWTLSELQGRRIPYVPSHLQEEHQKGLKRLLSQKMIRGIESQRLTKDGRILDVVIRAAVFSGDEDTPGGELVILRDITEEKRLARNSEALLRISTALPRYPQLEKLLDYISDEVKGLLKVEAVGVVLPDEDTKELILKGGSCDDAPVQAGEKELKLPLEKQLAWKVFESGEAAIVEDASREAGFDPEPYNQAGYQVRNILDMPLRGKDRVIGVLCAVNKKEGGFDQKDIELLSTMSGTVALSIENAEFSEALKAAYEEVSSLNRAKDKVINHLSHELKTPLSVLISSLEILKRRMEETPDLNWRRTMERAQRSLDRILDIQYQVSDIMENRHYESYDLLNLLLGECADELEALVAEETGEGPLVERLRGRIQDIFGPKESKGTVIHLDGYVKERLEILRPRFAHRLVNVTARVQDVPSLCIPSDVLEKVVDGLIKNAVENTPDEGTIEINVRKRGDGCELEVKDRGIGIREEDQKRIFEGFFSTQETSEYSSRRPFDFNAGGKGADLLRMRIFGERYNFRLGMTSTRCPFLEKEAHTCAGKISACSYAREEGTCEESGTVFTVFFPPNHSNP